MTGLFWAIAWSVLSAISYAAAAVVQDHLAARPGPRRWAVPLLLTGIGAGLHVIALRYAAVGVVQALGTLTLIFALPMAAVLSRRRITGAAWQHAWLTVGGLVGLLTLVTTGTGMLSAGPARWLPIVTAVAVAALALAAHHTAAPRYQSLLLAGGAGAAFGVASVLTKTALSDLTTGRVPTLATIAIVGLSAAGQVLSQRSYGRAGVAAPLAVVSVTNPVVAGLVGILLLGDGVRFGGTGAVLALTAAAFTVRGVIGLTAADPAAPTTVVTAPNRVEVLAWDGPAGGRVHPAGRTG